MSHHKLSLFSAILININIMLGSGVFINTVLLSKNAGAISGFIYPLVGLLLLPIVYAIASLMKSHQGGNFYNFGAAIHPAVGFFSIWTYFIAKMASAGLAIHICNSLMAEIFQQFKMYNILFLDLLVIVLFVGLNTLNLRIGRSIQFSFIVMKMIPILFVILSGVIFLNPSNFQVSYELLKGIPISLPFVIYAFSGFEASCSLASSIVNPERNGPRAIYISYFIVIAIVTLFQTLFYLSLGSKFYELTSYLQAYPALIYQLFQFSDSFTNKLIAVLHLGIAASALGAAYGIMYSNSWNMFFIATKNGRSLNFMTRLNKHGTPYFCVIFEGILAALYLFFTGGYQVPLQQISAFGGTVAYTISVFAFIKTYLKEKPGAWFLPFLCIASSSILIFAILKSFWVYGVGAFLIFLILSLAGFLFYKSPFA